MSDPIAALRASSLFEGLDDDDLRRVAALVERVAAKKDQLLFAEGSPSDAVYFIESGEIRIGKGEGLPPSRFARFLATLGPGDVFGELSLLLEEPRTVAALVTEDALLLRLSKGAFTSLLEARDDLAWRLLQALLLQASERLRDALGQAAGDGPSERLLSLTWR